MKDNVNAIECSIHNLTIANITLDEFGPGVYIRGLRIVAVYLRHERIDDPHTMSSIDKGIHEMGADKTGATSNQHVKFLQQFLASNVIRDCRLPPSEIALRHQPEHSHRAIRI